MSAASDETRDDEALPPRPDLRAALRAARIEDAERSRAIADLQGAELARLEVLQAALGPVMAQVPPGVDLFDTALVPGPRPRLFIDMIGFVEMAHDKRRYLLVQDTREGRRVLSDSASLDTTCEAVTAYVARRLIEREKALASTEAAGVGPRQAPRPPTTLGLRLKRAGRLVLEYLGLVSLVVLAWVLGDALYHWITAPRP